MVDVMPWTIYPQAIIRSRLNNKCYPKPKGASSLHLQVLKLYSAENN